jgi:hypothetical protein
MDIFQLNAHYGKKDLFGIGLTLERNDARVLLYSPTLMFINYYANLFRITGNYSLPNDFVISGRFSYINIKDDKNEGNDFQLRAGKLVDKNIIFGYEFYYANYSQYSTLYYSPRNFESHSIWADWKAYKDQEISLTAGGKLGYVPASDFILKEIYGEVIYNPVTVLTISGRISVSSSDRYGSNYSFWAGYITAYLSIF